MTLGVALSLAHIGLASALVAHMALRRVFRPSPVFFAYLCFDLGSSAVGLAICRSSGFCVWYLRFFLFAYAGDLLLYLWVLAELGKNLLRFNRKSRPQWKLAVPLFVVAAVLIGSLSRWAATPSRTLLANICFLTMRADGALEFAGFLALISWSGLRKLRWPERELRIATGFGFVAFVWFLVSLLEFKWNAGPVYYWLYQSGQAAGLAALAYWLYYFWIDAEREPAVRDAAAGPDGASNRNDPDGAQRLGMV